MSRTAAVIVACALGAALVAVSIRSFRRAIACGGEIEARFTRVHGPLAATLLLASAAWAWIWWGGEHAGAWAFTVTDAGIVAFLAFGAAILFGRDTRLGTGSVVAFWASAVFAVLVAGGQRVTMIEGQSLFLAGLVLVWSGLPRFERSRAPGARPPRSGAALMYALALSAGIAASIASSQGHASGTSTHLWLILVAAAVVAAPALLGASHGLGTVVWFACLTLLTGAGSVPIANTLSIGLHEALASRAMGNPWWLSHLREAYALNIYTGGSVTILPDAFALIVLSIVAMFVLLSVREDERAHRGLAWRLVGIALLGLGIAYAAVRTGPA